MKEFRFAHAFISGLTAKLQAEVKRICIGWEMKDVKDMLPYINRCNSLIEQCNAEATAKLMHAQINGPGASARGRHVNYNAHYNGASRGRGRGR